MSEENGICLGCKYHNRIDGCGHPNGDCKPDDGPEYEELRRDAVFNLYMKMARSFENMANAALENPAIVDEVIDRPEITKGFWYEELSVELYLTGVEVSA